MLRNDYDMLGLFFHCNFYDFYNAMKTLQQEFWQNIYLQFFQWHCSWNRRNGKQSLSNCWEIRKAEEQSLTMLLVMRTIWVQLLKSLLKIVHVGGTCCFPSPHRRSGTHSLAVGGRKKYSYNIRRHVTSGLWETSTYGDEKEPGTGLGLLASLVTGLPRYFGKRFNLNAKYISTNSPWFDLLGVQSEMDRCSFGGTLGELDGGFIKNILEVYIALYSHSPGEMHGTSCKMGSSQHFTSDW